jgi:hypothetical protein
MRKIINAKLSLIFVYLTHSETNLFAQEWHFEMVYPFPFLVEVASQNFAGQFGLIALNIHCSP